MKTVAIIQARTGSSRLPGKVLKEICGKTILEWVIERVKSAKQINEICVATTKENRDDSICQIAENMRIKVYRGSEHDVLSRFIETADCIDIQDDDMIVRITADCPLIDPEIIDKTITFHKKNHLDYSNNVVDKAYFPRGFDTEIFSCGLLRKIEKLTTSSHDREHVTTYIRNNPQKFRIGHFKAEGIFRRPDLKLCVDTQEDYERVQLVIEKLKGNKITAENVIKLFEKPRIAVICEGSEKIGTGHVIRPLKLLEYASDMLDCDITFFMNKNDVLLKKISAAGYNYTVYELKKTHAEKMELIKNVVDEKFDIVIVDLYEIFQKDVKSFSHVFAIDENYSSPEQALLSKASDNIKKKKTTEAVGKIIITFGGSDPNNLTLTTLVSLLRTEREIDVVLGALFKHKEEIRKFSKSYKKIKVFFDVKDMAKIMSKADIAVCNGGTTMYELCYLGVPCIVISQTSYEAKGAEDMQKNGAVTSLGLYDSVRGDDIRRAVESLINDFDKRKSMSTKGGNLVKNATPHLANDIIYSLIPV